MNENEPSNEPDDSIEEAIIRFFLTGATTILLREGKRALLRWNRWRTRDISKKNRDERIIVSPEMWRGDDDLEEMMGDLQERCSQLFRQYPQPKRVEIFAKLVPHAWQIFMASVRLALDKKHFENSKKMKAESSLPESDDVPPSG